MLFDQAGPRQMANSTDFGGDRDKHARGDWFEAILARSAGATTGSTHSFVSMGAYPTHCIFIMIRVLHPPTK
jgi:hypothetical protein